MPDSKNEAIRLLTEILSLLKEFQKELSNQGYGLSKTQDDVEIPVLASVEKFSKEIGAPSFLAGNFYWDKEAVGWRHNGQPVVNWKALFRKYVRVHDQKRERETEPERHSMMDATTRAEMARAAKIRAERPMNGETVG